ncbi:MAG TPA: hypothetical protein VGG71_13465 [Chitinophagaceae bacterium]
MNNKKIKYFLIFAVSIVWGIIISRLFKSLSPAMPSKMKMIPNKISGLQIPADTFSLILDYPDPFVPDTTENIISTSSSASKILIPPTKPDISFIRYTGLISGPKKKSKIAILNIHGKEYLMKEGDKVEDIHLIKIEKNEIKFKWNGAIFSSVKN